MTPAPTANRPVLAACSPSHRFALRRASTLALLLLGACAQPGLRVDLAAKAPVLDGYGQAGLTITTLSAQAQAHFNQGLRQAYAFNEAEAVRMFKAALAADPVCAMCAWGVAWQLGPNINAPGRDHQAEALRYADLARRNSDRASERERAWIDAMALRYGQAAGQPVPAPMLAEVCAGAGQKAAHPLDQAYADHLHALLQRWPDDTDLLTLWAEAELVATRGDWWPVGGQPAARIGELARRLEAALALAPSHTGLNHYLIHTLDNSPTPGRALAAADRLGTLAPASPHLVHMPSHIHVRVGQFAQATRENQQALALDAALAADLKRQQFEPSKDWRGHNLQFAWFAALMEGRGDLALQLARRSAERSGTASHAWAELGRSQPQLTLLRLERWDALLAEPLPTGQHGLARALTGHARAIALLRRGQPAQARALLADVTAGAAAVAQAHAGSSNEDRLLQGIAQTAVERLQAELAMAEGRPADALAAQMRAAAQARRADNKEPPLLGAGARPALGDMQLRAGQAAAAELSFREDLAAWPASGWALRGLQRALAAQGRTAEAQVVALELTSAWPRADAALR